MEWGCLVQSQPGSLPSIPDHNRSHDFIGTYLPEGLVQTGGYYSNGSRIYVDVGEHIEYATPEDSSLMGTVANEIAGERVMHHILDTAKKEGKLHDFALNKRVVDESGLTWGYHESYLADATAIGINADSLGLLGVHLASRGVFAGAGAIYRKTTGSFAFHVTQKSARLNFDFGNHTTGPNKPVVNLRNEPHADNTKWLRIHVTSGDPNMSPWATFVKLGSTSLVLRLIEHGDVLEHLRVPSLVRLAGQVAIDASLQEPIQLIDQTSLKPYEIQAQLCEAAQELSKDVELPGEEQLALQEWQQACDDLKRDPSLLKNRADWIAKKIKLERYAELHQLGLGSMQLQRKDRQWDILDDDHGIGMILRQRLWKQWMPDEALISARVTTPPSETRACIRGNFIKAMSGICSASWTHVGLSDAYIHLLDPYMAADPRVDQLIASSGKDKKVA
jgi:proteasome accessory factor A